MENILNLVEDGPVLDHYPKQWIGVLFIQVKVTKSFYIGT